jgi:hypothetical protein
LKQVSFLRRENEGTAWKLTEIEKGFDFTFTPSLKTEGVYNDWI